MGKRKLIDWDTIEPLYKIGKLSNYQICEQYAADHKNSQTYKTTVTESGIRKHAKDKGWQKNLASKYREQVKEKLVRTQVRTANQKTDDQIIEEAASQASGVIIRHREEIAALIKHEQKLLKELYGEDGTGEPTRVHVTSFKGRVKKTILGLTVKEKSATLKDLAAVRAQRIALERQAHGLDEYEEQGGNDPKSRGLKDYYNQIGK